MANDFAGIVNRPSPPYLKRAPDLSAWVIVCKNSAPPAPSGSAAPGQPAPTPPPPPIRQISVVKDGNTIFEERIDAAGGKTQRWITGGMQVVRAPGSDVLTVQGGQGEDDLYNTSYSTTDFSGFGCLADEDYTETRQVSGRDCLIFRGRMSDLTLNEKTTMEANYRLIKQAWELWHTHPDQFDASTKLLDPSTPGLRAAEHHIPAVAVIDAETRLPVVLQVGMETRVYQFMAPPGTITLPPDVQQAIAARNQRMKAATAVPDPHESGLILN